MNWYSLLADIIVAVHVAYVSFVVLGQGVVVVGWLARWEWIRNFWFRMAHFTAMVIVAVESIVNFECPLTTWEYQLRNAAGQVAHEGSFIGRFLHDLMFFEAETWVFTTAYLAFTAFMVLTLVMAPPRLPQRFRRKGKSESDVCLPQSASVNRRAVPIENSIPAR